MSDQRADTLLAFLLGAAVGAGVALLLAPQSGAETRKLIGDRAKRLGEDVDHRVKDVRHELQGRAEDLKEAIVAGKDAFKKAARQTVDEIA